jgi:osmotically inducible protein OsmC
MARRQATARWEGSLKEGTGSMAFGSGAFEGAYSFQSRFEEGTGTNPEELIGAAHAGCFSMALSGELGRAGHEPESIETEASVHLTPADGGGFEISRIDLRTRGRVPGIDAEEFRRHAETAKQNCPVSQALASVPEITVDASLED